MTDQEKLVHLEHVLNSGAFKKAPTSSRLLKFLTISTIEGKELKETTVGMELFGESFLRNDNSSRIRVNIYNLRKKLEAYYSKEGKNDLLKIEIKKGQYYTKFIINKHKKQIVDYKKRYTIALIFSGILLLMGTMFLGTFLYRPSMPIWKDFFDNKKETILVVGDFFGVIGRTVTGKIGWNRDYNLNSSQEFYSYKESHPELDESIIPSDYTYITGMGAIGTHKISKLFEEQEKEFTIRFSSKLDYEEIKENNTIYIGPIKNNNKFLSYLNNKKFNLSGNTLHYRNVKKKQDTIINLFSTGEREEYAIVSRIKAVDNSESERFLFFSNHDMGVIATVEYFTNKKTLEEFEKTYLKNSESFTALFLVEGRERTNLGLELILVDSPSN